MGINLSVPAANELKPRIIVIGVGGAGGNAVNNMINSALEGVEFVVANTDAQALSHSLCERRIQLGTSLTQGLGAGARPDIGRAAAEEALDQLIENLQGSHMAFITAGMGGGTGTGAAPVVARAARELGILTVGVVTKPFQFEGSRRLQMAEAGIEELQQYVDTLIIIPNQNLFRIANEKTTFADAFKMADNVLHAGVRGVTDLMVMPGLINLDFADVRTVMSEMGKAMMGTGEAEGQNRAVQAAEAAIANPLLDDVSMKGARGVLINITGGMDLTLYEVDEAANRIRSEVDPEANIIVGSTFNDQLSGKMRVSVVATGIDVAAMVQPKPSAVVTHIRMPSRSGPMTVAPALATPAPVATPITMPVIRTEPTEPVLTMPSASQPVVMPAPGMPEASVDSAAHSHFVPPRPIEPTTRREPSMAPDSPVPGMAKRMGDTAAEAMAEQARPSLFNRVFRGISTSGSTDEIAEMASSGEETTPQPAPAARTEPSVAAKAPTLAVEPVLQPTERREDDLLDIPTFLRRQAN